MLSPHQRFHDPSFEQSDIRRYTLNVSVPRRASTMDTDEYIYFVWDSSFPAHMYDVAMQGLDVNHPWRLIGPLAKQMMLPRVFLDPHGKIAVLPKQEGLPAYYNTLERASTYQIKGRNMIKIGAGNL